MCIKALYISPSFYSVNSTAAALDFNRTYTISLLKDSWVCLFSMCVDMWAYTCVWTCVWRFVRVYLCLLQEAVPFFSSVPTLIVSALMPQSLACPQGYIPTFFLKTFQLKIVAPTVNLAPLSMCFSLVPIPAEKTKNGYNVCSPEGGSDSYPLAISVTPYTMECICTSALQILPMEATMPLVAVICKEDFEIFKNTHLFKGYWMLESRECRY